MAITFTKKILIILGIVALSFVVLVAVLIGLAFYVTSDLESDKDFQRESQAKQVEGREFAKTTNQNGCIKEGLNRAKAATTFEFKRGQISKVFPDYQMTDEQRIATRKEHRSAADLLRICETSLTHKGKDSALGGIFQPVT